MRGCASGADCRGQMGSQGSLGDVFGPFSVPILKLGVRGTIVVVDVGGHCGAEIDEVE